MRRHLRSENSALVPHKQFFVGREKVLMRLLAALKQAVAGSTRTIMLAGEPGIGKTRTAEKFADGAREMGTDVLWGRCYEGEGAPSFWPWIQIVRGYLHSHEADEVRRFMGTGASAVAEMVPYVAEYLGGLDPLIALDNPISSRFRIFDSTATSLKNASDCIPMVIVLDDLHWADGPSLLLLEFLANQITEADLLILGTYRDAEIRRGHQLKRTLGDLARDSLFERIPLKGLGPAEVEQYIDAALVATRSEELAADVHARTDGNPLFVSEVVRMLAEEEDLPEDAPRSNTGALSLVPEGIREVIGRRLGTLSDECYRALAAAAVIGREFSVAVLEKVLADSSRKMIAEKLDEASLAGIVEDSLDNQGQYRFDHALTQQTMLGEQTTAHVARLHVKVLGALEAIYGEAAAEHAVELVEHCEGGKSILGSERLIRYLLHAGERALSHYAYEQALEYFNRGMEVKKGLTIDEEAADLLYGIGRAKEAMLDVTSRKNFRQAFNFFERSGKTSKAVSAATFPFFFAPWEGTAIDLCERCLALVSKDSVEAAHLLAKLGLARVKSTNGESSARELLEEALRIARREKDIALEMRVLSYLSILENSLYHNEKSFALNEQALALAQRIGDLHAKVEGLWFRTSYFTRGGDINGAVQCGKLWLESAKKLRVRFFLGQAYKTNGALASEMTDWSRARMLGELAYSFHPELSFPLWGLASIARETGGVNECNRHLERAIATAREAPLVSFDSANMAWQLAIDALQTDRRQWLGLSKHIALDNLAAASPKASTMLRARLALSCLAVIAADPDAASEQFAAIESASEEIESPFHICGWLRGLLLRTMGRLDEAIEFLDTLRNENRERGARKSEAWSTYYLAETLLVRRMSGDEQAGGEIVKEAIEMARQRGMVLLEEKALSMQKNSIKISPKRRAKDYPGGLSTREVEVLRHIVKGKTNKEIGAALFISPKTVNNHVRKILEKTASSNRAEAAAYSIKNGLN